MRIAFVVQRFGDEFVGGAEKYVMEMATGLVRDGHHVEVVTSCATSYADWADEYPPGVSDHHGVRVERLPGREVRPNERFIPLHLRAVDVGDAPLWPWAQERWSQLMGPDLLDGERAVAAASARNDVTVLVGYHYAHSLRLTRAAASVGATVVVPTAHPEGAFHVGRVRQMFEHADRVVCLSPEEADLCAGVHGVRDRISYVPCPVEPIARPSESEVLQAVRDAGATPGRYVCVVGRVDPAKGSDDAVRFVSLFRRAVDPDLELVVIGPGDLNVDAGSGVRAVGFVPMEVRDALVAGSAALVQPSYMESFSLSLIEGWMLGRPALVQARSRVLAGHVERSHGGVAYGDYLSFEAALAALLRDPALGVRLAEAGRRYSLREFAWERVAADFTTAMQAAIDHRASRTRHRRAGAVDTRDGITA